MASERFCNACGEPSSDRIVTTCDSCGTVIHEQIGGRLAPAAPVMMQVQVQLFGCYSNDAMYRDRWQLVWCLDCARARGLDPDELGER